MNATPARRTGIGFCTAPGYSSVHLCKKDGGEDHDDLGLPRR